MDKPYIRLRGIDGPADGKSWESGALLRVGRQEPCEVVLVDASVSRCHAEIHATETGWELRDLDSTNGTFVNQVRLSQDHPLRVRDVIKFGKVTLAVDSLGHDDEAGIADVLVEAATRSSWDQAVDGIPFDLRHGLRPEEQLVALLRASYHLGHHDGEGDLLQSILKDAVATLQAQHGAMVLAEGRQGELKVRAWNNNGSDSTKRSTFSHTLARRAFNKGESILCSQVGNDPELAAAHSVERGDMASVLCVLLRTPRKRLGVLHLDRGYQQEPYDFDDLYLADALAASVSAGIESSQLLRQQREMFLNTVTALAHVIDLRDPYTGDHTYRVTRYAQMLGQELSLPPEELDLLRLVTPLHDIGKIGIDDAILRKPGKLTPEEFEVMKTHTTKGAAILASVPELENSIGIVRSHHEQWNGRGYPDGLEGRSIPKLARIVAVADAFDAMTSDRPYRKRLPLAAAFAELKREAGRQFDPTCCAAFLAMRDKVMQEFTAPTTSDPRSGN